MVKREAHNKIVFTEEQHAFLRQNFHKMTNKQLADALGLKMTRLRNELAKLGLKRMELEYFTQEQLGVILRNWKTKGDTEIADMLNEQFPKNKPWTKKHICKKRRYLGLIRDKEQLDAIFLRNKAMGKFKDCPVKAWKTRGLTPMYEMKQWAIGDYTRTYIKTSKGYRVYARWLWELHYGEIPKGMIVSHIDGDQTNVQLDNLKLISQSENATTNRLKLTSLPSDLQKLILVKNKIVKHLKNRKHGKK